MKISSSVISYMLAELRSKKENTRFVVVELPSSDEVSLLVSGLVNWLKVNKGVDITDLIE